MRHKIVLHVHSLNTLAWAVQKNGKNKVEKCLKGLKWIWVPYTKPGIKLAELVRRNMNRETDIVILANHGLIIGGENCEKTKNLLEEVEARLKIPMRETQAFEEEKIKKYITTNYLRTPYYDEIHSISNDPTSFKIALRGPMYPDHLVFLGEKPKVIYKSETAIDSCLENCEIILKKNQCYVLIEGEGVLVDKNISQGAEEMLLCQALLLKRLKEDSDIVFLNKKQSLEIIDWDAEKFRRSLNCIPK
jgi:rhamnose utilization protein RhaD (predicted bifunctional aldolase and dehydrogenase)